MTSLDIISLFTNVPLDETINICSNEMIKSNIFQILIEPVLRNFCGLLRSFYKQLDGETMGSPLGPTLANTFLCYHEKSWLDKCPEEFKPVFYRRYVDNLFLLLRKEEHLKLFLNYFTSYHKNIEFTSEKETNNNYLL